MNIDSRDTPASYCATVLFPKLWETNPPLEASAIARGMACAVLRDSALGGKFSTLRKAKAPLDASTLFSL